MNEKTDIMYQKTPEKQAKTVWIHANAIADRNIANKNEINKRMDALCLDQEICKKVFGEEIYEEVKDKLCISKEILDLKNNEKIKSLPEFQEFLRKYVLKKEQQQEKEKNIQEIECKKTLLATMDIPENIQTKKDRIDRVKKTLREVIDEKQEKNLWARATFLDILKKNPLDEREKKNKANKIYDFIFEHMESTNNKKKRRIGEMSSDFYKRIGIDYALSEVRNTIEEQEKKTNEKIKNWKEKTKNNIKVPIEKQQEKNDYTQEALQEFIKNIESNTEIKNRFYLPKEKDDMEHIQEYFKKNLEKTIESPNMDKLIKSWDILKHTIEKTGEKIKIHTDDYVQIENRIHNYKKRFTTGERNPKEYMFDRLIEYVGKEILAYEIKKNIETNKRYRWTTCEIYKTDPLDDSSARADFMITYTFKNNKRINAWIDLFVSDKEVKESNNENNPNSKKEEQRIESGSLEEKLEKAKEPRIPYSSYIHLLRKSTQNKHELVKVRRYVEQQHPVVTYSLLKEIIENKNINIETFLDGFKKRGKLYTIVEDQQQNDNHTKEKIERQFNKNVIQETEKNAA